VFYSQLKFNLLSPTYVCICMVIIRMWTPFVALFSGLWVSLHTHSPALSTENCNYYCRLCIFSRRPSAWRSTTVLSLLLQIADICIAGMWQSSNAGNRRLCSSLPLEVSCVMANWLIASNSVANNGHITALGDEWIILFRLFAFLSHQ